MRKKFDAVFLDRDGVINYDYGHVGHWNKFDYLPDTISSIKRISNFTDKIFIVTNQAGIAKGLYTLENFLALNARLLDDFQENDIEICQTYYCPHHPKGSVHKYSISCKCRKPQTGMFTAALFEHQLDPKLCLTVGDKETDMIASQNAGIPENYLVKQDGLRKWDICTPKVYKVASLVEVAARLESNYAT